MTASWPVGLAGIGYGADYYPEQWSPAVRTEDLALMREAGVSIVSLAVFGWASIEPREDEFEWEWLDRTMDALHDAGIRVALGTATASPPPWLTRRHPEILPVDREGRTLWPGGRQAYAVSHPLWREYALRMAGRMATRYGRHPALALWHVDNELAAHVPRDYSDAAAAAFREWLRRRYGTIERLNEAWLTAFWSQRYAEFAEVLPPRLAPTDANPGAELDFRRFSSDTWRDWLVALGDAVRPHSPGVPVTTNVITMTGSDAVDLFRWRDAVDVVAADHYTHGADPERHIELALAADLARGLARGGPWLLAEHAASAVNWQPVNLAKGPGEMFRNSLAHVARGADAIMFFQWRQSVAGAERFHSAMLPHAGTDSRGWRRSVALGRALGRLAEVRGSRVRAQATILVDYEAWWAAELPSGPSASVRYAEQLRRWHAALWRQGITADIRHPADDLGAHPLVVVPTLTLADPGLAGRLETAAAGGAQVVVAFFSGILDPRGHVVTGGYPGLFRGLLGVRSDEFAPLPPGRRVGLDNGMRAALWTEHATPVDAETVSRFADGPAAGAAAITRRPIGAGAAWYVATALDGSDLDAFCAELLRAAGVRPPVAAPQGVETVVRCGAEHDYLFVINHNSTDAALDVRGTELLSGRESPDGLTVGAGRVAVLRLPRRESVERRTTHARNA